MSTSPRTAPARTSNAARNSAREGNGRVVSRVLFVCGELRGDSTGYSVLRLARELRRRGKEVALACGGGPLVVEFQRIGISPEVIKSLRAPGRPLWVPRKLAAVVRGFEPQLIQVFGRPLAGWGPALSRLAGVPYVLMVMTFAPSAREGRVRGDWRRGAVVALSEELREALVNQARIPKDAIAVIPIGIAVDDYERYRDSGGANRTPVVGTVGPLTADRGCDYFLRAAREILDRGYDVHFLIAGEGPERKRLRAAVRELNIEKWVTMAHHFTDYRRMIAVLDVCVIPALREGLSLNAIEAMACRKPVVATGVGAVYDIVEDGETGLLVPKKDPVALADKVVELLDDHDLAARIVEAAYQRVKERFSLRATVEQLLEFYSKCLARMENA